MKDSNHQENKKIVVELLKSPEKRRQLTMAGLIALIAAVVTNMNDIWDFIAKTNSALDPITISSKVENWGQAFNTDVIVYNKVDKPQVFTSIEANVEIIFFEAFEKFLQYRSIDSIGLLKFMYPEWRQNSGINVTSNYDFLIETQVDTSILFNISEVFYHDKPERIILNFRTKTNGLYAYSVNLYFVNVNSNRFKINEIPIIVVGGLGVLNYFRTSSLNLDKLLIPIIENKIAERHEKTQIIQKIKEYIYGNSDETPSPNANGITQGRILLYSIEDSTGGIIDVYKQGDNIIEDTTRFK